ncbi:uncharacterized protein NDAI_0E03720 [Naumovozyma dairenensis CBS 421]|uniref:Cyclin-like domain-containing protein n=1 Tax=Naumovozyma dairenensis (strain ATCC 10597 / BCRC 20456 / CBS 421 / NBRC 0211 / NRRL Y-12639) TaxID=1071378 RepID=G0WBR9_NAUDC|nr:hypothetical protein NDAI_0E03720 [Naumovozyma dairenensis CBS 421]CCD25189.1 hypothetical protein NDAI_0E03720 [Naumovozyma dairenensis CBS 421]
MFNINESQNRTISTTAAAAAAAAVTNGINLGITNLGINTRSTSAPIANNAATTINLDTIKPVDLNVLSQIRKHVANVKAHNPNLMKKEMTNHQSSINEYSKDILNKLITFEYSTDFKINKPDLSKFKLQPEINESMRNLIFDFLMCCHTRLKLSTSTLFLAYSIIDRFSSKFLIKNFSYQLISLTALWISSKYWDSKYRIPTLKNLQNLCCNQYSKSEFKEMELQILKAFNWSVCQIPTHDSVIDILLFLNQKNIFQNQLMTINEIKMGSIMLCELASFNLDISFEYNPSMISITSINLMKLALTFHKSNKWDEIESISQDNKIITICHALLEQLSSAYQTSSTVEADEGADATSVYSGTTHPYSQQKELKRSTLPTSFNSKYNLINNKNNESNETTSTYYKNLFTALYNYSIQWQLNNFYASQSVQDYLSTITPSSGDKDIATTPSSLQSRNMSVMETPHINNTSSLSSNSSYLSATHLPTPSIESYGSNINMHSQNHHSNKFIQLPQLLTPLTPTNGVNMVTNLKKRSVASVMSSIDNPNSTRTKKRIISTVGPRYMSNPATSTTSAFSSLNLSTKNDIT